MIFGFSALVGVALIFRFRCVLRMAAVFTNPEPASFSPFTVSLSFSLESLYRIFYAALLFGEFHEWSPTLFAGLYSGMREQGLVRGRLGE